LGRRLKTRLGKSTGTEVKVYLYPDFNLLPFHQKSRYIEINKTSYTVNNLSADSYAGNEAGVDIDGDAIAPLSRRCLYTALSSKKLNLKTLWFKH
jgi:hypothetical protein